MKRLIIAILLVASPAMAGSLRFGGTIETPMAHSTAPTVCNDGEWAVQVAYEHPLVDFDFLRLDGVLQGMLLKYTEAHREYSWMPREDKSDGYTINLTSLLKPTLSLWRIDMYLMAGVGYDYMQLDGSDIAFAYGFGADFQITDHIAVGVSTQKFKRHDTGRYTLPKVLSLKVTF